MDSTRRFSDRVENYIRYRPSYPGAVLDVLGEECGLTDRSLVADVGSGTGILTQLLLETGSAVFAVEPNKEMREAAERILASYPRFKSVDGTAEATTLPDRSVDIVTAGQAFHWFDRVTAREEFRRILRPEGWVTLVWNERKVDSTPFLAAYEELLLSASSDYEKVDHRRIDEAVLTEFFAPGGFSAKTFPNSQSFDYEGLKGRFLSSSYVPLAGHPAHETLLASLEEIFQKHQKSGRVDFDYVTTLYYGRLL